MIYNTLIFVPARGGSQSVPLKNLYGLAGHPLIRYCLVECMKLKYPTVVSTDNGKIRDFVGANFPFPVTERPMHLSDGPIHDVVKEYIEGLPKNKRPEIVVLVQPTSPFVRKQDIEWAVEILTKSPQLNSAQTLCQIAHNDHAWNQRIWGQDSKVVDWYFPKLRSLGYQQKQNKPTLWKFGNVVATRASILQEGGTFFAPPSIGRSVPWENAIDVDTLDDFQLAEALIKAGVVG